MGTFDEREKAFEGKFVHDQELQFAARARRNKLLGLWAAEKMGLSGAAAETYAKDLVAADLQHSGDVDVIAKLKADFAAKKISVSDGEIATGLDQMMQKAKQQLAQG